MFGVDGRWGRGAFVGTYRIMRKWARNAGAELFLGKAVGEIAHLKLPGGVRQLKLVELRTIHDVGSEEELAQEPI